jgi:hypothetical protein
MVFYLSCKNWSSKVYTSFVKVVVPVTQSTTKLVLQFLDFSTILHGFYKVQHLHPRSTRDGLRKGPRISRIGPQDENLDCNAIPRHGQWRRWPESGEGKAGLGR